LDFNPIRGLKLLQNKSMGVVFVLLIFKYTTHYNC